MKGDVVIRMSVLVGLNLMLIIKGGADEGARDEGVQVASNESSFLFSNLKKMGSPSDNFELIAWKLTLPSADEVQEKDLAGGYEGDFFFTDKNTGGMVFRVSPRAGTTAKTSYPRCELREMLRGGDTQSRTTGIGKNNWVIHTASSSAKKKAGGVDGLLEGTLRVDQVTCDGKDQHVGRVIIGQIHGKDDEPCRLYYRKLPGNSKGSLYFASEKYRGDDDWYELIGSRSNSASDPIDGVPLGEVFSYAIELNGRDLTVKIMREGRSLVSRTVKIDSLYREDYLYFRAGAYLQDNSSSEDQFAQVTFFALKNSHD